MSQSLSIKEAGIGFDDDAKVVYYEWRRDITLNADDPPIPERQ
ncbi:hypothetical protein [Dokdonella immobilis]|uniref:Uncharacterized protein n=1 Tax=Dokdonella immobilis TaxID=578942 RepID=A0A1I4Z6C3_9GAMM|nr:hypothetical protein [Dokdonella immobilis]SFN45748.1 hypothetical protein SAMN05216289_1232 [Dokdonella immobilis]